MQCNGSITVTLSYLEYLSGGKVDSEGLRILLRGEDDCTRQVLAAAAFPIPLLNRDRAMRRIFWGFCMNQFGIGPLHYIPILASNSRPQSKTDSPTRRVDKNAYSYNFFKPLNIDAKF